MLTLLYFALALFINAQGFSSKYNTWNEFTEDYKFELEINGLSEKFDRSIKLDEFTSWVKEKFETHDLDPRPYQIETAYNIIKNNEVKIKASHCFIK